MKDFLVEVVFENVDLDDDALIDRLADVGVLTADPVGRGFVVLSAVIEGRDPVRTALDFVDAVGGVAPQLRPVASHRDLVGITDIAERVGVTREAVRHWASGKRRTADFPRPAGEPGGSKVWEWASVQSWLRVNLGIWDELERLTTAEMGQVDHLLFTRSAVPAGTRVQRASEWTVITSGSDDERIRAHAVSPPAAGWRQWSESVPVHPAEARPA